MKLIETVHTKFLRNITKLRKSTPLYMLYAELGRAPLEHQINSRMMGFWISLVNGDNAKISKQIYNILIEE